MTHLWKYERKILAAKRIAIAVIQIRKKRRRFALALNKSCIVTDPSN
jgi:hypothetical protein